MERRRIEFSGACYHVIQRGNNREQIFRSTRDKKSYLNNLVSLKTSYDFLLLGYVLMDNHYHLLIRTGDDPLHKIIFRQNMFYSRYFNNSHQRSGHLYGDRYKASIIQDDHYLFSVLRYIHYNPVKAGMCQKPGQYKWSSDESYRQNNTENVDIDFILNMLSLNRNNAIKIYLNQMQEELRENEVYDKMKYIGDEDFIAKIKADHTRKGQKVIRKPLDDILENIGITRADIDLIKSGSRKRSLSNYKKKYVREAIAQGYSYKEIGENIKISDSAVALYCR